MRRFSARTIITVTVAVVAAIIVLTSINLQDMIGYVQGANPFFLVTAFALGLATYVGSAMALVAFSPEKLSLWRTTLVQVAASIVGLVAPAGVGPAALNLRFLQKNKLDTPMAVATVALVQVSQFLTTVLLLLSLALVTGSSGALDGLPSGAVLIVIGVLLVVLGAALFVPTVRRWALAKIMPTIRQIWPRLVWVVGQPGRLVTALVGNVIMTAGYIAAFGFTLHAFGAELPAHLAGDRLPRREHGRRARAGPRRYRCRRARPHLRPHRCRHHLRRRPLSSMVFRLVTFWIRIPLGWFALQHLQKRNLV
ncbi:lysylphosphatidylglycerol synthase transmembrane domain-containing protein [Salana multivorans]